MGYDLHITRALWNYESVRYPILDAEVVAAVDAAPDLFTPPDAPRHPGFCYVFWTASASEEYLLFHDGHLSTKNPGDAFRRRMIDLAKFLDAWLIGQDAELYERDGDQVVHRWRSREEYARRQRLITRDGREAIPENEWMAVAATQPDLTVMDRIEVRLPSGLRRISCPPVVCWTGHPSGRPIPFFHDETLIEVSDADEVTEHRMTELAAVLTARVTDPNQP